MPRRQCLHADGGDAIKQHNHRLQSYLAAALDAQKQGQLDRAAEIFELVLGSSPNHMQVLIRYGVMLMGQNQLSRANELLHRATQCDSPMKLHAQRAYELLQAKETAMVRPQKRQSMDKGLSSTVLKAVQRNRQGEGECQASLMEAAEDTVVQKEGGASDPEVTFVGAPQQVSDDTVSNKQAETSLLAQPSTTDTPTIQHHLHTQNKPGRNWSCEWSQGGRESKTGE